MAPPINPDYPLRPVGSLEELMGIAVAMEHEAAARYEQMAAAMAGRGEDQLARLFGQLAELERDHEHGLGRWAAREGRAVKRAEIPWPMPETFGEAGENLTPYGALRQAVANEERAFTFYTYLAAMADSDDIRRRAEALAREELNHLHLLRRMRRSAYHDARGRERAPSLPRPRDREHFHVLARALEAAAAALDQAAADLLRGEGDRAGAAMLAGGIEAARRRAGDAAAETDGSPPAGAVEALRRVLRHAEDQTEFYVAAADRAGDEALLHDAQALAERAVGRLAVARALLDDHERRRR